MKKYATLGELCSHTGTRQLSRMKGEFKSLRRGWDEALLHRLRIHGKRLRYLLEPFEETAKVSSALKELRRMQDQLGDYRDQQLLLQHLESWGDDEEIRELIALLEQQQRQLVKDAKKFRQRSRQQRLLRPLGGAMKKLRA